MQKEIAISFHFRAEVSSTLVKDTKKACKELIHCLPHEPLACGRERDA